MYVMILILKDLLVNISYLCILRIQVLPFLAPESSGELVFKKIISFLLQMFIILLKCNKITFE